jgi:hypothetical protein
MCFPQLSTDLNYPHPKGHLVPPVAEYTFQRQFRFRVLHEQKFARVRNVMTVICADDLEER